MPQYTLQGILFSTAWKQQWVLPSHRELNSLLSSANLPTHHQLLTSRFRIIFLLYLQNGEKSISSLLQSSLYLFHFGFKIHMPVQNELAVSNSSKIQLMQFLEFGKFGVFTVPPWDIGVLLALTGCTGLYLKQANPSATIRTWHFLTAGWIHKI